MALPGPIKIAEPHRADGQKQFAAKRDVRFIPGGGHSSPARAKRPLEVSVLQSVDASERSKNSCKTIRDGDALHGEHRCTKSARRKPAITGDLEAPVRLNRDCHRMNLFGVVMNKGETHMRFIDDKISCAQTGQELFAAKVIND